MFFFSLAHLLGSAIRFHFGKSSTLMNINVLFFLTVSVSFFANPFPAVALDLEVFSCYCAWLFFCFSRSCYCLNWNFHLLLFVFLYIERVNILHWFANALVLLSVNVLTKAIMDAILQKVIRLPFYFCVRFQLFEKNYQMNGTEKWLKMS